MDDCCCTCLHASLKCNRVVCVVLLLSCVSCCGAVAQAVHHLFPQVGWGHYTALAPIVAAVAKQHGINYTCLPSFGGALGAHYTYLYDINQGAEAAVWFPPPQPGRAPLEALGFLDQLELVPQCPGGTSVGQASVQQRKAAMVASPTRAADGLKCD